MLEEVGGFDEDLFAYADDAELGLRARIAGWGCLYNPGAVVYHRRGQSLGMGSRRRLELIERNRVLLVLKLFPPGLILLNPLFYFLRLVAGVVASFGSRGDTRHYPGWAGKWVMFRALLGGDAAALGLAGRMLRKRREIRRFRKLTNRELVALLRRFQIPLWTLVSRG
jgi:GT2 family glycosyltransferase